MRRGGVTRGMLCAGTVLKAAYAPSRFILPKPLLGRWHGCLHFTDEETEIPRSGMLVEVPRAHWSWSRASQSQLFKGVLYWEGRKMLTDTKPWDLFWRTSSMHMSPFMLSSLVCARRLFSKINYLLTSSICECLSEFIRFKRVWQQKKFSLSLCPRCPTFPPVGPSGISFLLSPLRVKVYV